MPTERLALNMNSQLSHDRLAPTKAVDDPTVPRGKHTKGTDHVKDKGRFAQSIFPSLIVVQVEAGKIFFPCVMISDRGRLSAS